MFIVEKLECTKKDKEKNLKQFLIPHQERCAESIFLYFSVVFFFFNARLSLLNTRKILSFDAFSTGGQEMNKRHKNKRETIIACS